MRVVVIGAGGHAQVVADTLLRAGHTVVGFLERRDATTVSTGSPTLAPVIGSDEDLEGLTHDAVIVGIGDNERRRIVFERMREKGARVISAIHPSAVIAPGVDLGPGTFVAACVVVNTGSQIGCNVILNTSCSVDHHGWIGDHAHVAPGARLGGQVHVGARALVGIGSCVLPSRRIGAGALIGGGAVVTHDVEDDAVVVGVPARVVEARKR